MTVLKTILRKIKNELVQKEKIQESTQQSSRKATSFSKQAILLIHQKRLEEAKKLIEHSKELISILHGLAKDRPEIVYSGMFSAALQEYSEANLLLGLILESRFLSPNEIDVPGVEYILGLADVIGEFRRLALDAIRESDVKKGEKCLNTMDEIYTELMAMDEAHMLVPGLRRKCDVARKIIESTRGDITQEIRRTSLESYLRKFESLQK